MKEIRYSKQREAIYQYLISSKEHPSAETIYFDIKKQFPHISFGTIYRNLNFLADQGKIRKLNLGKDTILFDGNTALHHHFVCNKCHKIYDINFDLKPNSNDIKSLEHRIDDYSITMNGICKECLKKER